MNFFKEEESDRLKDRRMERGGVDGNNRYNKAPGKPNTWGKKPGKKYDGMSALEKVKADIRAKHGKGAIKEDAKMGKQSDEKLAALHKQVSGADQSLPSNQFMLKRVTKEMNRRKKATKTEGYAPGDVDQKVGAVTPIPKKDQDDARARILAKAKAKRAARLKSEGVIVEGKKKCKECGGKGCSHCKDKGYMVTHDCSKKIEHAEWGVGECISEMHTLDEQGNITHYDILFEHGVEQNVPVELLTTLVSEMHEHAINDEKNEIVEKKGLWANIHAKRKRGEKPAKKGDKDYPETLNVEGYGVGDVDQKLKTDRDGMRVPNKDAAAAKARLLAKAAAKRKAKNEEVVNERGDFWHPDPDKDKKLGGPGANARAREDRAASKPKEDPKKLRKGESYMDWGKRQKANKMKKEELELDERTRYAKETGKDPQTGKPSEKGGTIKPGSAMSKVRKSLAGQCLMSSRRKAIQPQGKKK